MIREREMEALLGFDQKSAKCIIFKRNPKVAYIQKIERSFFSHQLESIL
jgi:hypothetical protein